MCVFLSRSVQFDTEPQTRQPSNTCTRAIVSVELCFVDVDVSISADATEVISGVKSGSYPCGLVPGSTDDELVLGVHAADFLIVT